MVSEDSINLSSTDFKVCFEQHCKSREVSKFPSSLGSLLVKGLCTDEWLSSHTGFVAIVSTMLPTHISLSSPSTSCHD